MREGGGGRRGNGAMVTMRGEEGSAAEQAPPFILPVFIYSMRERRVLMRLWDPFFIWESVRARGAILDQDVCYGRKKGGENNPFPLCC